MACSGGLRYSPTTSSILGKPWIVGQLEGRHQVRLQAMRLPDRLNARRRDAHRLGHRPQAPMGGVQRRFGHRLLKHPVDHCHPKRRLARRARLVAAQAVHAGLDIARPPASDGRFAHAQAALTSVGADAVASQLATIRARRTCFCGVLPLAINASSLSRSLRAPAGSSHSSAHLPADSHRNDACWAHLLRADASRLIGPAVLGWLDPHSDRPRCHSPDMSATRGQPVEVPTSTDIVT